MEFYGFYFDFSGIFSGFNSLKIAKRLILSRGTRGVDMAQGGHVTEPREATRGARRASGWQVMGSQVSRPR